MNVSKIFQTPSNTEFKIALCLMSIFIGFIGLLIAAAKEYSIVFYVIVVFLIYIWFRFLVLPPLNSGKFGGLIEYESDCPDSVEHQYELTPEEIEKALMLIEGEIDYGRRMNYKNDTISLMVFEKVKTLGYRLPIQAESIPDDKREAIIHLLEDKDAHFTANWVIADQILSLLTPKVMSDEEIVKIIFKPGERGAIEEARQIAQAQLDKWDIPTT